MKRIGIITALSMLLLALSASVALAVAPGTYPGSLTAGNAPGSSHLTSGTVQCVVNASLDVNCGAYVLGGVGHTDANVVLTANYTAIIDCFNGGSDGGPIESHTTSFSPTSQTKLTAAKNGQLSVLEETASFSGAPIGCPNSNWTPKVRPGTLKLTSFTYTLTFVGFTSPYVKITASDP